MPSCRRAIEAETVGRGWFSIVWDIGTWQERLEERASGTLLPTLFGFEEVNVRRPLNLEEGRCPWQHGRLLTPDSAPWVWEGTDPDLVMGWAIETISSRLQDRPGQKSLSVVAASLRSRRGTTARSSLAAPSCRTEVCPFRTTHGGRGYLTCCISVSRVIDWLTHRPLPTDRGTNRGGMCRVLHIVTE